MRQVNDVVLSGSTAVASVNGSQIDTNQMINISFHCVLSNPSAGGAFKLQASNDVAPIQITGANGVSTFVVTNWVDIPSQSVDMTSVPQGILTLANVPYRWMRAVFTTSSQAAGTVKVSRFGQGI